MRGTSKWSMLLQMVAMILPWGIRRFLLTKLLGFRIHPTARIGYSLVLANRVRLDERTRILNLTMIKGMAELELDRDAVIGNLNWITGMPPNPKYFRDELDRISGLYVREAAAITNRHLFDCSNRVTVGRFTTIGGFRSQFLTHSIDMGPNHQGSRPIEIGEYCFTGTGVIVLKGAALASRCVLSAGSMLRNVFVEEYMLVSGNPAKEVRKINPEYLYFSRTEGEVT